MGIKKHKVLSRTEAVEKLQQLYEEHTAPSSEAAKSHGEHSSAQPRADIMGLPCQQASCNTHVLISSVA